MTQFTGDRARISRRRVVSIIAATVAAGALPRLAYGRQAQTFMWRGVALGAEASLTLQHPDEGEARAAIEACLAEVARLEEVFSLFRPGSALQRLNASGRLEEAPADLRILLAEALQIAGQSNGSFDPTIQPLWALYSRHFSDPVANKEGPGECDIQAALQSAGWRSVEISGAAIYFRKPGMAVTLNGIAQGYITDKVGDLLRARGFSNVLVNMGEQLALGSQWDGNAWSVGIADPADPERVIERVSLASGAIATSGGYGCRFDAAGRFTHILDPRTGRPARQWASMSVVAERATRADGLSTALSVVPPAMARDLLGSTARAFVVPLDDGAGRWL
ncbi:MAG: FAD:protein FMN transferase [Hyphomicrobium sp.]